MYGVDTFVSRQADAATSEFIESHPWGLESLAGPGAQRACLYKKIGSSAQPQPVICHFLSAPPTGFTRKAVTVFS